MGQPLYILLWLLSSDWHKFIEVFLLATTCLFCTNRILKCDYNAYIEDSEKRSRFRVYPFIRHNPKIINHFLGKRIFRIRKDNGIKCIIYKAKTLYYHVIWHFKNQYFLSLFLVGICRKQAYLWTYHLLYIHLKWCYHMLCLRQACDLISILMSLIKGM